MILGNLKFSHSMWNCLKCLCGFSLDNPLNFGNAFSRSGLNSHSASGYSMLLWVTVLWEVASCLMVLCAILFGLGSGKGMDGMFVTGDDKSGWASDVGCVLSVEHTNFNLLRTLRKFLSTFGLN